MTDETDATHLLHRMARGDAAAEHELFAVVHDELHRLAERHMAHQGSGHTLQPTALVNEAWLRLVGRDAGGWEDSQHFLSFASRVMRSVLVDHARRRGAAKRGADGQRVPLDAVVDAYVDRNIDVLALDDALTRLGEDDPELARVVDLRVFGGLSMPKAAMALGISRATAERRWRLARVWLRAALEPGER